MKLTLRSDSLVPRWGQHFQVELDGHDISAGVMSLSLNISNQDVNTATIEITPSEIDIDAEAMAVLEAHVKGEAPDA